ncbi:hypothetical protein V5799_000449 [Amblyomma americanum]|uniref:Secreted protein n=1 Tax=Amblyomma americanum TaxID=6943 RepID=A0AAQ4D308_AMBAM
MLNLSHTFLTLFFFCRLVPDDAVPLEPPRQPDASFLKKKYQSYKGPRRKKKMRKKYQSYKGPSRKKKMRFMPSSRKSGEAVKGRSPGDDLYGADEVNAEVEDFCFIII